MKDSTDRLLDALEHPENYTDAEIEQMLGDPMVREGYDMLHRTADASASVPEINLDEEWLRFEEKHSKRRPVILRWFPFMASRNAAAVLLAFAGTLAVVAATIGVTHYIGTKNEIAQATQPGQPELAVIAETSIVPADSVYTEPGARPGIIIFKGANLEAILADIAKYHGVSVVFNQYSAKSLQLYFEWDQALPLREVVDQLNNFEQIDITLTDKVLTVK